MSLSFPPACATNVSTNDLLTQNFTGDYNDTGAYYSCAFLSNYTQAPICCSPNSVHTFDNPCYSWCDLPAIKNEAFDSGETDYFQWMINCLNSTGEKIGPLWCHAQPHVIFSSPTSEPAPTSTFDAAAFCATSDPQSLIAANDPAPACGILPNQSNTLALEACCQPAPVKWSVAHCYEYCALPRGTAFRGVGNLTYDEALGSFKTCMLEKGNQSQSSFDGLLCRVNGSAIDIGKTTFGTTTYLTGGGARVGVQSLVVLSLFLGALVAL